MLPRSFFTTYKLPVTYSYTISPNTSSANPFDLTTSFIPHRTLAMRLSMCSCAIAHKAYLAQRINPSLTTPKAAAVLNKEELVLPSPTPSSPLLS